MAAKAIVEPRALAASPIRQRLLSALSLPSLAGIPSAPINQPKRPRIPMIDIQQICTIEQKYAGYSTIRNAISLQLLDICRGLNSFELLSVGGQYKGGPLGGSSHADRYSESVHSSRARRAVTSQLTQAGRSHRISSRWFQALLFTCVVLRKRLTADETAGYQPPCQAQHQNSVKITSELGSSAVRW